MVKRIKLIEAFLQSGTRPEWMIMKIIPVIPPELRPLVPLDGGRFATSDLNDLYRRVINRNNRLKRLMELQAPDIIIRNEKRMLQESVDALFDNGRRGRVITGTNKRPLKSLSDMLKGKQGRFRQNLLGKRVDYSGRSVIVVGPELKLHQCGLPKKMALELFRPFIYAKLELYGHASTIKAAKKMLERERPEVWEILEEIIREHPVMLNRAPTLHRLGIQAFEPVLVEGKAISLHPLVCSAFNADFDGDQMAVHVPLSLEAQLEARVLMMSTNNILSPSSGKPIIVPSQDIILGLYYVTLERHDKPGGEVFIPSKEALKSALKNKDITLHNKADGKYTPVPVPDSAIKTINDFKDEQIDIVKSKRGAFDKFSKRIKELPIGNNAIDDLKQFIQDLYKFFNNLQDKKFDVYIDIIESKKGAFDNLSKRIKDLPIDNNAINDLKQFKQDFMSSNKQIDDLFTKLESGKISAHRIQLFAAISELEHALDEGVVTLHTPIKAIYRTVDAVGNLVREKVRTTVGRMLLSDVFPKHHKLPFDIINRKIGKKEVSNIIDAVYRHCGPKETVVFADKMMEMGFRWACRAGISFGKEDMLIPPTRAELIEKADGEVKEFEQQYQEGLITGGEKYNKVVDVWSTCADKIADEMMQEMSKVDFDKGFNSVYMMANSGARGSLAQMKQLGGMRGLMAKSSGEIIETPIKSNFKQGLTVLEYFTSAHGARKGLTDTALKTANSGYLTRRLVDVAQDCIVTESDCGCDSDASIKVESIVEGGNVIQTASERALGRVVASDVIVDQKVIIPQGTLITEDEQEELERRGIDQLSIRSVLTCQAKTGVCAKCYGRDLSRGDLVNRGEAVGVIAAQSIGEPGTQLTMRTFHIGGVAQGAAQDSSIISDYDGIIEVHGNLIKDREGLFVLMDRSGELIIKDSEGRERAKYKLKYGYRLTVNSGNKIKKGKVVAKWDPSFEPIVAEVAGTVKMEDLIKGDTLAEVVDERTGITSFVVRQPSKTVLKPRVLLQDDRGDTIRLDNGVEARYFMSEGAVLLVQDGEDTIQPGDVLARIPLETVKTRDITGGLPRVAELFEARKPKDFAMISPLDGYVEFGKDYKTKRRLIIKPVDGASAEIMVPKGKKITVREGEFVGKGDKLVEGATVPHDILEVKGVEALAEYLVQQVQDVYRLQGVKIDDKHIEVVIRQMLQKVEVTEAGDSYLVAGEEISREEALEIKHKLLAEGKQPIAYKPILQGITKASLHTNSFISAASFQETTRVLTEAAVYGKSDSLVGLKENVIVGRLIPAGTGAAVKAMHNQIKVNDSVAIGTEDKQI